MSEKRLNNLEVTREKMIKSALEKGISNSETIKLSKELDHLLNEFQYDDIDEVEKKEG